MKILSTLFLLISVVHISSAQKVDIDEAKSLAKVVQEKFSYQRDPQLYFHEIDSLVKKAIEKNNNKKLLEIQQLYYRRNENNLKYFCSAIKLLDQLRTSIEENKENEIANATINQINNPVSSILNFKFSDEILKIVENNIEATSSPDAEKSRLKGTFVNLLNSLGQAFPPINVLSSVITAITQVTTIKTTPLTVKIDKIGKSVINSYEGQVSVFNIAQIGKFNSDIKPYLDFYSTLNNQSISHIDNIKTHTLKHKQFTTDLDSMIASIKTQFKIDIKNFNRNEKLSKIFYLSSLDDIKTLTAFNEQDQFKNMPILSVDLNDLLDKYTIYYLEYALMYEKNKIEEIAALDKAKLLPVAQSNGNVSNKVDQVARTVSAKSLKSYASFSRDIKNDYRATWPY